MPTVKCIKTFLFSVLLLSSVGSFAMAAGSGHPQTVGYMHPLGHQKTNIIQDVGQIFDSTYGIIRHESETILQTHLKADQKDLPVYAPYAGRILSMLTDPQDGETLVVLHRDGSKTKYSDVIIPGDTHFRKQYKKGDIIAHLKPNAKGTALLKYELVDEDGRVIKQKLKTRDRNEQNFVLNNASLSLAFYNPDPFNQGSQSQKIPPISPWDPNNNAQPPPSTNSPSGVPPLPYSLQSRSSSNTRTLGLPSDNILPADLNIPDRALCPEPTASTLVGAAQARLDQLEEQRNIAFSSPPGVHDLSCFDNFAANMAINVAQSGIFGTPLNIFGVDVSIDRLIEIGVDAANGENCRGSQAFLDRVKFANLPADFYYTGYNIANFVLGKAETEDEKSVRKFASILDQTNFDTGIRSLIKGHDLEKGELSIVPKKSISTGSIDRYNHHNPLPVFVHGKALKLSIAH
jgi:hypothetical protein